jgi:hypothetical protein
MIELTAEENNKQILVKKPMLFGLVAGTALLSIYFLILTVANSFTHAIEQFQDMWYWIFLLVAGFGVQVGLFTYMRAVIRLKKDSGVATSTVAAAGGISTTSMVACCAHHVTDVLPILGVSAAAVFLNQYQNVFIIVGVLSNLIGITVMLRIIQKHDLYAADQKMLAFFMKLNMNRSLYVVSIVSAFSFMLAIYNSL